MSSTSQLEARCDAFNAAHPVDSVVALIHDDRTRVVLTTVSAPAHVLGGHTPVVTLTGVSGCYALDRVRVIDDYRARLNR